MRRHPCTPRCSRRCCRTSASASAIRRASTASAGTRATDMETAREQIADVPQGVQGRDRLHLRRHGVGQSRDQGHRRREAAGPHRHLADRAPRGAADLRNAGDAGLHRHLSAGGRLRHGATRRIWRRRCGPTRSSCRSCTPTPRSARSSRSSEIGRITREARRAASRGRRPDVRQGADRRGRVRHRPALLLRPQDLRPEGGSRSVSSVKGTKMAVDPAWRRARAAPARRHRERGGHRGPRQGRRDPRSRHGRRGARG